MKIVELVNNHSVAITNEEANLLLQFDEDTPVMARNKLDDRQQLIANQLVNKNLLVRLKDNGQTIYKKRTR